jgi:recombination protein RecA
MQTLEETAKLINKVYGPGTLMIADEALGLVLDRTSSGVFDVDMKIGGGYPRGRITVIKGEYSSGKSVLCLLGAAHAQQHCRYCGKRFEHTDMLGEFHEYDCECKKREAMRVVWLDAEHSFDHGWAQKWGLQTSKAYVIQTEYAEQAIDVADKVIRSKECDFLVVDSVAALTPSVEIEQSSENWQVGVFARLMNKALRKWTSAVNSYGLLAETKCTILLINQMRLALGGYHPTPTSPGGKGIDFFQSLELRLKRSKDELLDFATNRPIGINVEYVIKKNKTAPLLPGGEFKLFFISQKDSYRIGDTNNDEQVLKAAAYWNLIHKAGGWFTFPDGSKVQSSEKAALAIRKDPELLDNLAESVRARELSWATTAQEIQVKKK